MTPGPTIAVYDVYHPALLVLARMVWSRTATARAVRLCSAVHFPSAAAREVFRFLVAERAAFRDPLAAIDALERQSPGAAHVARNAFSVPGLVLRATGSLEADVAALLAHPVARPSEKAA